MFLKIKLKLPAVFDLELESVFFSLIKHTLCLLSQRITRTTYIQRHSKCLERSKERRKWAFTQCPLGSQIEHVPSTSLCSLYSTGTYDVTIKRFFRINSMLGNSLVKNEFWDTNNVSERLDYNMAKSGFLCIYSTWGLLSFLEIKFFYITCGSF